MVAPSKNSVTLQEVDERSAEQRIDNYLSRLLKGVPRSHVYRILRSGEVRVNSRRVDATYRLKPGDQVRVPPVRTAVRAETTTAGPVPSRLVPPTLFEDDWLLAVDKPSGLAVHGGSGVARGVIELLRQTGRTPFLELVHRLDRETSGVLLLAKKRGALTRLHELLRAGQVEKRYLVFVRGRWRDARRRVSLPLHKFVTAAGERRVSVRADGQESDTVFTLIERLGDFSLLEAQLGTGRTHQIRVQLSHLGYPVAGDDKYGDFELNRELTRTGLKRMFLHAWRLAFEHPMTAAPVDLTAALPPDLQRFLQAQGASSPIVAERPSHV
ncbi:MAG: RluA family pseudouridine synthase [Betaproteobacteria bacterium]|nr:RluA family pseudouridine synthase [Betaproteobacteria bacterium]